MAYSAIMLPPSALERYFAANQFSAKYLMSCSDAQPLSQAEVLAMADEDCKAMWNDLVLSYTQPQGHPVLRSEAAKLHGVEAKDILTAAPQEAIYLAMNCLIPYLKQRHNLDQVHVIATFPTFPSLYENTRSLMCDMDYWTAKFTPKGWTFDFDELKKKVKENTKLIVVNFPHNPTGFHPKLEDFLDLIDFCKSHQIFLFSDEMYRFTNNDGSIPLPSPSGMYVDAMTLFGLSKTTACPGLRLGWLATKNVDLIKRMIQLKDYLSLCSAAPAEILAIIIVRNLPTVAKRTLNIVKRNLDALDDFFRKHSDVFEWYRPASCTITFVKLKGWVTKIGEGGATEFCKKVLEESKLMLVPSNMFEIEDEYVRVGFGRENLPEVLQQLDAFLETNKPK